MESILTIIIALIVALLVIGGAAAFAVMNMDVDDSSQFGHVINKIKEKVTGGSSSEGSGSSGEASGRTAEKPKIVSRFSPPYSSVDLCQIRR